MSRSSGSNAPPAHRVFLGAGPRAGLSAALAVALAAASLPAQAAEPSPWGSAPQEQTHTQTPTPCVTTQPNAWSTVDKPPAVAGTSGCTMTLTGAVTLTSPCTVTAGEVTQGGSTATSLTFAPPKAGSLPSGVTQLYMQAALSRPPATGQQPATLVGVVSGRGVPPQQWIVQSTGGTLSLQSVTTAQSVVSQGGSQSLLTVHGSMAATLTPAPQSGASGNVTVVVRF